MSGRTRVAWPRLAGRRKRAVALTLSVAIHAVVLGWFALKRAAGPPLAETLPVNVELVRLRPPPPPPPVNAAPSASAGPRTVASPHLADAVAAPPASTQAGVDPRWSIDLNGPVFADGKWPRSTPALRTRCDPLADPKRLSIACRREDAVARGVTLANDPANGDDQFAREARHNEAVKRYHELPGTSGYPGIACQILHKC